MRKLLCFVCCICLMLLSGCAANTAPASPIVIHSGESAVPSPAAAASPVPAKAEEDASTFVRGAVKDHVYSNAFANLHITLDEHWQCADTLELESMTVSDADGTLIQLTDLHAVHDATGETIVVMYENLARSEGTALIAEAEYAKAVADTLRKSDEFRFTMHKIEKFTLCGQNYYYLRCSMTDYDMELVYLMRRTGNMMTVILLSGTDPAHLTDLFS